MNSDLLTIYSIIATFYTMLSVTIKFLEEDISAPPVIIGLFSALFSIFIGWLFFPFLLIYNVFFKKTLI